MNEKSEFRQVENEVRGSITESKPTGSTGLLWLGGLVSLNIIAHTFYSGFGFFNEHTPTNLPESFLSAVVIYVLIVAVIAILGTFFRKFSLSDFNRRFIPYFIYLQLFFVLIHSYQILSDWIKNLF